MSTLKELLLTDEKRPMVVNDCCRVIDEEVASKRGVSGLAIKAAFRTVKAFKAGIIPGSVNALLDDFVAAMEPFYTESQASGGGIQPLINRDGPRIAEALLGITDQRAARSKHRTLVGAYKKLRPKGKEQVVAAMPRVGAMLQRHGA
jgi:hypothetical protein